MLIHGSTGFRPKEEGARTDEERDTFMPRGNTVNGFPINFSRSSSEQMSSPTSSPCCSGSRAEAMVVDDIDIFEFRGSEVL